MLRTAALLALLVGVALAGDGRGGGSGKGAKGGGRGDALVPEVVLPVTDPCPGGCISFVVNVHDVNHVGDSADTLLHLVDIYTRQGVKGEFYLTGPMVELYKAQRPDVIERLRSSGMAISYHVRAPHPLVNGFEGKLADLSDAAREALLRDYETYALDRATGELDRTKPGGYALVRDTFGRAPITVVTPNRDARNKLAALHVYRSLGARTVVWYHEEQASLEHPITSREGLVVRPSDIGLTRWLDAGGVEQFWWNRVGRDPAFNPTSRLKERLAAWTGPRGAFVTALVHENNFYRAGPEGWTLSYYSGKDKETPLPPPWNLNPKEESRVRSADEQAGIWAAYEELVRWSKGNLRVVTGGEIADMAK
ncbi:MAG: hypothetical protein Q8P41_04760 [Pseudomonadota bacterium]|nr:hypothetical protein [Pseudomonadota bacterium]